MARRSKDIGTNRTVVALAAGMVIACGSIGVAGVAPANPVERSTGTYSYTYTLDGPVTCNGGPTYTLTGTVTSTDHLLENPGGRRVIQSDFTEEITGIPLDPSLPTVTATTEGKLAASTSTQGAFANTCHGKTVATYSDGSTETASFVGHTTVNPYHQKILNFDRCH
ncbi:hypothetical protein ACLBYD_12645 [Rhodococcus sp. C26F]